MAGFANLFYLGQPDPAQQLARMLSGQQQPGQQPPPGPPPPAAASPSAGGAGADPNAPAAPPAPGNLPPNSGPQPQALQSSPDMSASYSQLANNPNIMSLYVQMAQRDQAMQGLNSAFAQIAANHSPPSMRAAIMQNANAGAGDAGGMVGNLMSLYQNQQQMGAQQALLAQAPAIDKKNGWPDGTARAEILAGRGPDLIKSMEPTDLQRNYNWAHDKARAANPNGTEAEIENAAQGILLGAGAGGMGGADVHDRLRALNQWKADPANAGQPVPPRFFDDEKWKLYSTDLNDAKTQFDGINNALGGAGGFIEKMSAVANNPNLESMQGHPIAGGLGAKWPAGEQNQLMSDMTGLGNTAKDLGSRGGPKGLGQNLKTIGSSPEDFTNLNYTDYRDQVIAPRMRQALTAQADAHGAAGQLSQMPGYLKPYLNKMYQPGGEFDPGGGFKSTTPDTDSNGKPLPQPDAAHLQDFKTALEHRGPQFALKLLKDAGFDTSSLR